MQSKRGSIITAVLLLILAGGFSIRNHRLLRSHMYIEKGLYSVDVRIQKFLQELELIETIINERYVGSDFLVHMKKGRKEKVGVYSIYYDEGYNEGTVHVLIVEDTVLRYLRRVELKVQDEEIQLINKGV
ncbi:hypothetical protein [Proteiniclasticum ruminis]|uniref:Uncharacterized protein n=1 Tax=Proteiniclasticum ruminis TaxID=398199 RepID=A0A1I4Y6M8_9CLOT|nr:hypothetical protein [Proteiniclasticum ruminis]SFN33373.1 hypothetical protein SAMN04488695_101415 [Proteiniclasticum ruminis]